MWIGHLSRSFVSHGLCTVLILGCSIYFGYVIYIYVYLGDEKEGWVNNLQSKVKREYLSNGAAFQFRYCVTPCRMTGKRKKIQLENL